MVYFCVKFYVSDPTKLNDELTRYNNNLFNLSLKNFEIILILLFRYLFYLQIKKDILTGRLPVQFDYAVDLYGYFLQSNPINYLPN